jgi:Zn2+/Cd2+-exporting ATPase
MSSVSFSTIRVQTLFKEHPDALAAIICGLLVFLGWLALHIGWVGVGLFLLPTAYVIGGYESTKAGLTTLFQDKQLDVDLLMIVAALGAASLGLWHRDYYLIVDGAMLILIFAISGALEGYAMQRTERSIHSLMSLTSDTARVLRDNTEVFLPVEQLQIDAIVLVKPGELIPTDGVIIEGDSTVNQAPITGESIPVEKTIGDEVFAGSINGFGALRLRVHQTPEGSLLQRIIRLVEHAQTEIPPSQQFLDRVEKLYANVIILGGLLLAILPHFVLGWDWETSIYRSLIFLVVASPCALMAAIMPTLLSGIANGARHGILFKNGAQLETIGRVKAMAFDKTGTLTTGKLKVVKLVPSQPQLETQLLQVAAALESVSEHPIGNAIVQAAQEDQLEWSHAFEVQAKTGLGITGIVDNKKAIVGKAAFVLPQVVNCPQHLIPLSEQLEKEGKTVVWVALATEVLGIIAVADTVRPEAVSAIEKLKKLGINPIVMLTGDNENTAQNIGKGIGIDAIYSELLPEEKVNAIRDMQKQYETIAMVGDGINDTPALALASVGIAMGVAGSDAALESADIILMADRLEQLERAINLGRRSQVIIKQNIVFALSFIFLLLVANFLGDITLPFGVIGHEGSTVIVTLNGLRLLRD